MESSLPVIAAVDGSEDSIRALDWAADAAASAGAPLHVVHIWADASLMRPVAEPLLPPALPAPRSPVASLTNPVLDRARDHLDGRVDAPDVRYTSMPGTPSPTLVRLSAEARLLVLGSRGRGGFASLLLGSNGRACAAHAACPVVVVPGSARQEVTAGTYGRVVLGLAPAETSEDVVDFAFAEAERRQTRLRVVTTYALPFPSFVRVGSLSAGAHDSTKVERELTEQQNERLIPFTQRHYPSVEVDRIVTSGDAAGRLVVASQDADLVVVGRHRRRLRDGGLMGSVANAVLLHAHCPVAVVPVR